jgi:hypothetical protein
MVWGCWQHDDINHDDKRVDAYHFFQSGGDFALV